MHGEWKHETTRLNGVEIHYVRSGGGAPLMLLHGWPEFWYAWRKLIPLLADRFDVVAPDLRGFGESEKPSGTALESYRLEDHAADALALADHLGWERFGIVSHDIGAMVAQALAQSEPERLSGLFFFNLPYPGIGARWCAPDHLNEIWYQGFNQQPWAADLIASSRDAVRIYFGSMLAHWSHDPRAFEEDLNVWTDNFMRPGNLQGGFNWYSAILPRRLKIMRGETPAASPIDVPACVRWGESDPVLKVEFADNLPDCFSNLDFAPVPQAGHFVHYERPDYAAAEIRRFFDTIT